MTILDVLIHLVMLCWIGFVLSGLVCIAIRYTEGVLVSFFAILLYTPVIGVMAYQYYVMGLR